MKRAVALAYQPEKQNAPILIAKGEGLLAQKIVERAREAGVQIWEDPGLTEFLSRMPLDQEIPREIYTTVAVVFKALARIKKEKNI